MHSKISYRIKKKELLQYICIIFDFKSFFYLFSDYEARLSKADNHEREMNPAIERATNALKFVAQHVKNEDSFNSVSTIITNIIKNQPNFL